MASDAQVDGTSVARFEDWRTVRDLIAASWEEIDLRRGAAIGDYFTDDAIFDLGPTQYVGRDGIVAAFAARRERGPRTSRHMLTNQRVEFLSSDRARVVGYLLLFASDGLPEQPLAPPVTMGEIVDTCVREGGGRWLIESRVYRASFSSADNPSPYLTTSTT
jgi:SnoaL-like domain